MAEMTKVEIITRQSKLEDLKAALNEIGINGMTVTMFLDMVYRKVRNISTEVLSITLIYFRKLRLKWLYVQYRLKML